MMDTPLGLPPHCPECGARWYVPDACAQRYHEYLALEFSDPAYGAVHHLTVPAYQLQHPVQLSRRGWVESRLLLARWLAGTLPAVVRAEQRTRLASGARNWSITRGPAFQLPNDFVWSRTLLDLPEETVATAERYRRAIEQWARQVLADAQTIETE